MNWNKKTKLLESKKKEEREKKKKYSYKTSNSLVYSGVGLFIHSSSLLEKRNEYNLTLLLEQSLAFLIQVDAIASEVNEVERKFFVTWNTVLDCGC